MFPREKCMIFLYCNLHTSSNVDFILGLAKKSHFYRKNLTFTEKMSRYSTKKMGGWGLNYFRYRQEVMLLFNPYMYEGGGGLLYAPLLLLFSHYPKNQPILGNPYLNGLCSQLFYRECPYAKTFFFKLFFLSYLVVYALES